MVHHHVPQVKFWAPNFQTDPSSTESIRMCKNLWLFKTDPMVAGPSHTTSLAGDVVEELRAERLLLAGLLASATLVLPKARLSTVRP